MQIAATDIAALRRFGWQMTLAWPLFFGVVLPWLFAADWPLWPWLVAACFASLAAIRPQLLYWPSRLWFVFAGVMGWINTRLVLALVFFLLMTPLGLLLRALGKLDYQTKAARADSYWRTSDDISAENMKDPF